MINSRTTRVSLALVAAGLVAFGVAGTASAGHRSGGSVTIIYSGGGLYIAGSTPWGYRPPSCVVTRPLALHQLALTHGHRDRDRHGLSFRRPGGLRRLGRHDRHDRYDRYDRHGRHDRRDRHDRHDRHDGRRGGRRTVRRGGHDFGRGWGRR